MKHKILKLVVLGFCLVGFTAFGTVFGQEDSLEMQEARANKFLRPYMVDNVSQMKIVAVSAEEAKAEVFNSYDYSLTELQDMILFEALPQAPLHLKPYFAQTYLQMSFSSILKTPMPTIRLGEPLRVHSPILMDEQLTKEFEPINTEAAQRYFLNSQEEYQKNMIELHGSYESLVKFENLQIQAVLQTVLGDYYLVPVYVGNKVVGIVQIGSWKIVDGEGQTLHTGSSNYMSAPKLIFRDGLQKTKLEACTLVTFSPLREEFCLAEDLTARSLLDGHEIRLTNVSSFNIDETKVQASLEFMSLSDERIVPTIKEKSIRASFGVFSEEEAAEYIEFMSNKHSDRSFVNSNIEYEVLNR